MFYTTKNIISDYLIKESERAVLLFGGDSSKNYHNQEIQFSNLVPNMKSLS